MPCEVQRCCEQCTEVKMAHGPSCSPTHQVEFLTCMKLVTGDGLVAAIVINMQHILDHDAFKTPQHYIILYAAVSLWKILKTNFCMCSCVELYTPPRTQLLANGSTFEY